MQADGQGRHGQSCRYLRRGRICYAGCIEGNIVCHRHARGQCHRGDECDFSHDVRGQRPPRPEAHDAYGRHGPETPVEIREAMRIMNFAIHNMLTKRLVRVVYNEMILSVHPDRCNPADFARQNELMAQLTAARDVLLAFV